MKWHDQFLSAVVDEDERRIISLLESMPDFTEKEDMERAMKLISEAKARFERKKEQLASRMRMTKRQKSFLETSLETSPATLDIHS